MCPAISMEPASVAIITIRADIDLRQTPFQHGSHRRQSGCNIGLPCPDFLSPVNYLEKLLHIDGAMAHIISI